MPRKSCKCRSFSLKTALVALIFFGAFANLLLRVFRRDEIGLHSRLTSSALFSTTPNRGTVSPGSIKYPDVHDRPKKPRLQASNNFPKSQIGKFSNFSGEQLLEEMLRLKPMQNFGVNSNTIVGGEPIFSSFDERKPGTLIEIPEERVMPGVHFNTCAVVASSGGLIGAGLGAFIDSHEAVIRFNDAPTPASMKADVGQKTTVRFLNNKLTRNLKRYFQKIPELSDASYIISWEACRKKASLQACVNSTALSESQEALLAKGNAERRKLERVVIWDQKGILAALKSYFLRRYDHPDDDHFLLSTEFLWQLWDFLQSVSPYPIPGNPPSTGFIGVSTMLHLCNYITLVEFIPSPRARSRPCYYYKGTPNPMSPKAAPKARRLEIKAPQGHCAPREPATGWHPYHMEQAVMRRLGSIEPSMPWVGVGRFNETTYNGLLSVPVADVRVRRRFFD